MKRKRIFATLGILVALALLFAPPASAQTYLFGVEREEVDVFWEADGTLTVHYEFVFVNDPSADPIDFVDIGMPTPNYRLSDITAQINGQPIEHIEYSAYVSQAVELGLGPMQIPPGQRGVVTVQLRGIRDVLYEADEAGYASALFTPTWFGAEFVRGTTDLTVRFHLPPGVQPDEPRWHEPPADWPHQEPRTGFDEQGRIMYEWRNPAASASKAYVFGASFPAKYVPAQAIQRPTFWERIGISLDDVLGFLCMASFFGIFAGFVGLSIFLQRRRKLAYLPPKLAIEGHGIKRGLTAVEAAVILQTPLDRILTMILYSLVKKGAVKVVKEEPLEIQVLKDDLEGLRPYERDFIGAMKISAKRKRQRELQGLMIKLVKAVQKKMKGFSLRETRDYYRTIVHKAWKQVEEAQTPEVKSERFAEAFEWTMMDRDFDDRTRRTFRTGPVYLPHWWASFSPSTARAATGPRAAGRVSTSHSRTGGLPQLPGATFAASVVKSVQTTAGNLVGSVVDFTSGVTRKTNPPPVRTSGGRSYRGGGGCACACACAGCACACAGGGR